MRNFVTFVRWSHNEEYNTWVSLAAVLVVVCLLQEISSSSPYGRFGIDEEKLLVGLDPRLGWFLMELPCSVVFAHQFFVVGGPQTHHGVPRFFSFLFLCHYLYRGFVFPFLIRLHEPGNKNFDVSIALGGWIVTVLHAYLNARWYADVGTHLVPATTTKTIKDKPVKSSSWKTDPRFCVGLVLYYGGLASTIYHDSVMRNLRPCPGGARYCIPFGGLFEYVTMGHYFSELVMWFGFALASWGPNGLFIFLVSLVNLTPRSAATHDWYLEKFGAEYEALDRKRLIPFFW